MSSPRPALLLVGALAALAALAAGTAPAGAHVSVTPDELRAGEQAVVTLQVDHGCGDSPTTRLEVRLPDALGDVDTGPTRDWRVERRGRVLVLTAATPVPSDLTVGVDLVLRAPDEPGDLALPTVQTCESGEEAWTQVAVEETDAAAELERPAPVVRVVGAGTTVSVDLVDEESPWQRLSGPLAAAVGVGLVLLVGALRFRVRRGTER
ncbi:DUF1775 domain-containing protein [Nocardioides solisilvae]|uniref:DUF1775 domain-containing protein n=1 Tax=Nocardioides solisilvae TaxID=1542435 RepID=UPI0013A593F2|nr:DUF1775 domain-containing protein [Nocardioides solisilvae]